MWAMPFFQPRLLSLRRLWLKMRCEKLIMCSGFVRDGADVSSAVSRSGTDCPSDVGRIGRQHVENLGVVGSPAGHLPDVVQIDREEEEPGDEAAAAPGVMRLTTGVIGMITLPLPSTSE